MSRTYIWLPLSSLIVLGASAARATPDFPGVIVATLGLASEPSHPCMLCHTNDDGGKNTITQPFGKKAQAYGLLAYDVGTLASILGKMRDAQDDSDKDEMSDIDEIKAGRNPNINDITGEPPDDYPPPVYGCQAAGERARRAPPAATWAAVAAAMMGIVTWRSRMQRRRPVRVRRKDV
jgi:hypothetical protein